MEEYHCLNRKGKDVFIINFNGKKYKRYPDSKHPNYYFRKWKHNGHYYCERLHHAIYEYYKGSIPEGMVIHHIDKNPLNNDISNLKAVTPSEHCFLHEEKIQVLLDNRYTDAGFTKANWLERRKKVNEKLAITVKHCEYCGKRFTPTNVHQRFCTQKCYHRWQYTAECNLVDSICQWCGKEFKHNKYLKQKCCSTECSHLLARNSRNT